MVLDNIISNQRILATLFHFMFVVISKLFNENFVTHHFDWFEYSNGFQKIQQAAISKFKHVRVRDKRNDVINELPIHIVARNLLEAPHWLYGVCRLILFKKVGYHIYEKQAFKDKFQIVHFPNFIFGKSLFIVQLVMEDVRISLRVNFDSCEAHVKQRRNYSQGND